MISSSSTQHPHCFESWFYCETIPFAVCLGYPKIPWFLKSFSPWKLPAPPHPQTFSDIPKYNISDLCTQSHIKYFPFKVDACSHQPPISGGEQTGEGSRCAIWRVTWSCGYHWGWFDTSELTWINHQSMGYSWGHHWYIYIHTYIYIYGDIWWSFFWDTKPRTIRPATRWHATLHDHGCPKNGWSFFLWSEDRFPRETMGFQHLNVYPLVI